METALAIISFPLVLLLLPLLVPFPFSIAVTEAASQEGSLLTGGEASSLCRFGSGNTTLAVWISSQQHNASVCVELF
jgi:hypothetical protein